MDIQNIFYLLAIIFMVLVLLMLTGTVVGLLMVKKKIAAINQDIKHKVSAVKEYKVEKADIAEDAGALLAAITEKKRKK